MIGVRSSSVTWEVCLASRVRLMVMPNWKSAGAQLGEMQAWGQPWLSPISTVILPEGFDLEGRTAGGFPFEIDDFTRDCLLEGLDEIALTLRGEPAIAAYEAAHAPA